MKRKLVANRPIIIEDGITLTRPTRKELEDIKEALTFNNPAYESAKRYTRYNRVSIPPYLTYYTEFNGSIKVPLGFDVANYYDMSHCYVEDKRVLGEHISVPPFLMELRDNQKEALDNFFTKNTSPLALHGIVQLPTGKGKSVLGLAVAHKLSVKTLIVVHKDDLVIGWQKDIELAFGGKVQPGLIKSKTRRVGNFITIAMIQTLNRMSKEELEELYNTFGLVIQDELHHIAASTFLLTNNFKSEYKLGLTATPERNDGLTHLLNVFFGDFAYRYKQTKEDKDILPVLVKKRESGIYFNPVFTVDKQGHCNRYQLSDLMADDTYKLKDNEVRISDIPYTERPKFMFSYIDDLITTKSSFMKIVCEDILYEARQGHSCVVFLSQKEHCELYYSKLQKELKDKVQIFNGDTKDNAEAMRLADSREVLVTITTYSKGTEGTNVNAWEVEFLVSSINNEKNTEQASGRIRRLKDGKMSKAVIYDYRHSQVYTLASHGHTRDKRYKLLGFEVEGEHNKVTNKKTRGKTFGRGYR